MVETSGEKYNHDSRVRRWRWVAEVVIMAGMAVAVVEVVMMTAVMVMAVTVVMGVVVGGDGWPRWWWRQECWRYFFIYSCR